MNWRILHYEKLDSTNNLALSFAKEGAEEGTVVVAEFQTKGRGRFERTWISSRGRGLLFSILLRPNMEINAAPILTQVAAQTVVEVLAGKFKLSAKIKRPNDVLVSGKKIAGILTEASGTGNKLEYVVVGIGLNVTTPQKELLHSATSIFVETKQKPAKDKILLDLLGVFKQKYTEFNRGRSIARKSQVHV